MPRVLELRQPVQVLTLKDIIPRPMAQVHMQKVLQIAMELLLQADMVPMQKVLDLALTVVVHTLKVKQQRQELVQAQL